MALIKYNLLFIYNSRSLRNRLRVNSGVELAKIFSALESIELDASDQWIIKLREYASKNASSKHKNLIVLSGGDGSLQALINVIENEGLFLNCRPDLLLLASGSTNFFSLCSLDYSYKSLDDLKFLASRLSGGVLDVELSSEYMMRCERSSQKSDLYGFNVTGLSVVNLSESYLSYKLLSETSKKRFSRSSDNEKEANRFRRVLFFYSIAMILRFTVCRKIYEMLQSARRMSRLIGSLLSRCLSAKMRKDMENFKDVKIHLSDNGKNIDMSIYAFWLSAFNEIKINRYLSFYLNSVDMMDKKMLYFCCSHNSAGIFGLYKILRALVFRSNSKNSSIMTGIATSCLRVKGLEKILFDGEGYLVSKDETLTFSKPLEYRFVTTIM